jgi:glycosyltransferase involved in cell wall biosynthesis
VVTIHDILWHQIRGAKVTTLSPLKYHLKYQGYKMTVAHAVRRSRAILVPSNYVKQEIVSTYPRINPDKLYVTHEGISLQPSAAPIHPPNPYLVYVGSAYPHKNIDVILQALHRLKLRFKLVGSRSIFLDRIKLRAKTAGVIENIDFLGSLPDTELSQLLAHATALVHPSKSEGFGLTGLEAMAVGCPVIAAQATALPEIYGSAALYFDPNNADDLIAKVDMLTFDLNLRANLIKEGFNQVKHYSWDTMVDQTIDVYHQSLRKKP